MSRGLEYQTLENFETKSLDGWTQVNGGEVSNTTGVLDVDVPQGTTWAGCKKMLTGLVPQQTYTVTFTLDNVAWPATAFRQESGTGP